MGVSFSPRYSTAYLDDMAFPPTRGLVGGRGGGGRGAFPPIGRLGGRVFHTTNKGRDSGTLI